MVFLLGRMGDNKKALYLIIERLGDVNRVCHLKSSHSMSSHLPSQAIDFAKDQNDNDLWEDLLKYSETRPRELLSPFLFPLHNLLQHSSVVCLRMLGPKSILSASYVALRTVWRYLD